MVTTIEPGIYISPDTRGIAKKWRGIGIRLEDDVHISTDGPQVLTKDLPLQADDIEQLMASC